MSLAISANVAAATQSVALLRYAPWQNAGKFNENIGEWDIAAVTDLHSTFKVSALTPSKPHKQQPTAQPRSRREHTRQFTSSMVTVPSRATVLCALTGC